MIIEMGKNIRNDIGLDVVSNIEKAVAGRLSLEKNTKANVFFLSTRKMKKLNWESRHIAATTDVLSFPLYNKKPYKPDVEGMIILGDIMIDPLVASKKAKKNMITKQEEIIFLVVHGLLHLCGFDHDTKNKEVRMNNMTERIIKDVRNAK